jgi:hypothetical protein
MDEIDAIRDHIIRLESRVDKLEAALVPVTPEASHPTKPKSIREFINEKLPLTANDRALTIGYYLETVRSQGSFSADDIKRTFKEAKIAPPANVNDVINKNVGKGYMMDSDDRTGKKAWTLTATGEDIVILGFSK